MRWTGGATAKRVAASALLGATAVDVASLARDWDKGILAVAGILGVGAVCFARRSVLSQVLARGIAWMALTPMLVGLADSLGHGRAPDAHTAFFAATSAGALLLARPALHTDAAKAEFSPVGYRRVFLAGAVASVMAGIVALFFAAEQLEWRDGGQGLALVALSAALLASATGVVRMRAWGVLLGIVTSIAALGAALFAGNELTAVGLALTAIPGALLASPLVVARLRKPAPAASHALRAAVPEEGHQARLKASDAAPPVFARVAVASDVDGGEVTHLLTRRT